MAADDLDFGATDHGRKAVLSLLDDDAFISRTIKTFRRSRSGAALTDDEVRSEIHAFLLGAEGRYRTTRLDPAKSRHGDFLTALKAHAAVSLYHALSAVAAKVEKRRKTEVMLGGRRQSGGWNELHLVSDDEVFVETASSADSDAPEQMMRAEERRDATRRYGRLRSAVAMDPWSGEARAMRRFFDHFEKTDDVKASMRYAGVTADMLRRIRSRYGPFVGGDKE